jgi:gliding motility-associated-like protein
MRRAVPRGISLHLAVHIRTLLLFAAFFSVLPGARSQNETNHWFLRNSHIAVTPTGVSPVTPSAISTNFNPTSGSTSLADASGNLLFACDGRTIIDRDYNVMQGLAGVTFSADNNKVLAVNVPLTTNYLVFYSKQNTPGSYRYTLKYAVVNLALNGGKGAVISYDHVIADDLSQGFTLMQPQPGGESWLVLHRAQTDTFLSYRVSSAGLASAPVISKAGTYSDLRDYLFMDLKTSPDGKMIAGLAYRSVGTIFAESQQFLEVYNVDETTGKLTYKIRTTRYRGYFKSWQTVEFSPDNRLVYVGFMSRFFGLQPCGFGGGDVIQYNLCYTDSVSFTTYAPYILNKGFPCSPASSWGRIQLGADKRIHMPFSGVYVSTIDKPNRIGTSSTFTFTAYQAPSDNGTAIVAPSFSHRELEKAVKNNITYDGGCHPSPLTFRITNDTIANVTWNFGDPASGAANTSTLMSPQHVFSVPGIYSVTAVLRSAVGMIVETVGETVEVKDPGRRLLADYPKDTSICEGSSLRVGQSVVNGIFAWRIRTDFSEGFYTVADSISINSPGTYIVQMRQNDCNGCVMTDSIHVAVLPRPNVNLSLDRNLCGGDSLRLGPFDPAASFVWSTGEAGNAIWVKSGGTYWVRGEYNMNGCPNSDTIVITAVPGVQFAFPPDTILCSGQTLVLSPGINNANYLWQNGSTAPTQTVTQPGSYWARVTNSFFCVKRDTIQVSFISAQGVNLGQDTSICQGDSLLLDAGIQGAASLWSTGAVTPAIMVRQSGTYWVRLNNGSCTVTDTIRVTVNPPPLLSIGNDLALCDGERRVLRPAIPDAGYLWQDGSVADTLVVSGPGLYWVRVQKGGCTVRDSVLALFKPLPVVTLGPDADLCIGASLLLDASHPSIRFYQWENGSVLATHQATGAGLYWVEGTALNGCVNRDSIRITAKPLPAFTLGPDTVLCAGNTLPVSVPLSNASFLWSIGSIQPSASLTQAGWHWLEVTKDGCLRRDSVHLDFKPNPVVDLGKDTTLCEGATLSLQAFNSGASYTWNGGSTQSSVLVSTPGLYHVSVLLAGCPKKDSILIGYTFLPRFSLGRDTALCTGQTFLLDPGIVPGSFRWQDGSAAATYRVMAPGTYTLSITNDCGVQQDGIIVERGVCRLYLPNAFTPGGDGRNDLFRVKYPQFIKTFRLEIYNRWGQRVYASTDPFRAWDGTFNGLKQPMDNYVWFVRLTDMDGGSGAYHGNVLLIR